jgi:hypothetical protein
MAEGTRPGVRISATIQALDAKSDTITLKREDGKTVELQALAVLLGGLRAMARQGAAYGV